MKESQERLSKESQAEWHNIVVDLRKQLDEMHLAREQALPLCRLLIQTCSKAIKHIHRDQFEEAEKLLEEANSIAVQAREMLSSYPPLYYTGYLQDAEKELVEASLLYTIVQGLPYPSITQLGVGLTSYLNGTVEAASECRRYALDKMRQGDFGKAELLLEHMEMIYEDMTTLDYADSLTGGLRRSCDNLRGVLERTRSDLFTALMQTRFIDELTATRKGIDTR